MCSEMPRKEMPAYEVDLHGFRTFYQWLQHMRFHGNIYTKLSYPTPRNVVAALWSGQVYIRHTAMHWVETNSSLLTSVLTPCLVRREPSSLGEKGALHSLQASVVLGDCNTYM